jgi:hypothetical protein
VLMFLIVTVCSLHLGCREVPAYEGVPETSCWMTSQMLLAKWKESSQYASEDWWISSYRCSREPALRERT